MPDEVSTFGSLSRGSFLGGLVVALYQFSSSSFDFNDAEASSESVSTERSLLVEKIVKTGVFKTGVLLVDF